MGSHRSREFAQRHSDPQTEDRLDQELEQTFPASDALQITRDRPPERQHRQPKPPVLSDKTHKASV
jgi:hypothetical protein